MEWYPGKARAQARVNILNTDDCGWFVAEVDGGYAVRHDGSAAPVTTKFAVCLERVNPYRNEIRVKAA